MESLILAGQLGATLAVISEQALGCEQVRNTYFLPACLAGPHNIGPVIPSNMIQVFFSEYLRRDSIAIETPTPS